MKYTCKQAIFRKDTRRARRVEDPLRAGDQEERELEFFNKAGCSIKQVNKGGLKAFFPYSVKLKPASEKEVL